MTPITVSAGQVATLRLAVFLMVVVLGLVFSIHPAMARQSFAEFLAALWPKAQEFGISRATFDKAFKGLRPDYKLPDLILPGQKGPRKSKQAEFTRAPGDYLKSSYLRNLGARGRKLAIKHAAALEKIEKEFGVDRYSVLAIWGRETSFGSYKPKHDAIRVLATQAYVGRRKEMFLEELLYALRLLEKGLPRKKMRASWAGAMGLTQFMPSEFFTHAHDLGDDGYADLFDSVPDALASAARQLRDKGWVRGQTWGYEVIIPKAADCAMEGPPGMRSLRDWMALGFSRVSGRKFPSDLMDANAYLMSPAGAHGPSFLVLENYVVIRRYNTSDLYATFVGNLADRIAGGGDFVAKWRSIGPQKTRVIRGVQQKLKDAGYEIGKVDGFIGSNTRRQVGMYQRKNSLKVDCWPSERVLAHMRANAP